MATLVADIVRDAYRESNLISIGTEPSGAQKQEAIRFVNRVLPSVLGNEAGEILETYNLDDTRELRDDTVYNNTRVLLTAGKTLSLNLPKNPRDGSRFAFVDVYGSLSSNPFTLNGNGTMVDGSRSKTYNTDNQSVELFYRADTGNWHTVSPLVETDLWPFPPEFDDMFIITLAFRFNPRYNISSAPESMSMLKRTLTQFRARYRQSREVPSDYALLRSAGANWRWGQGDSDFDTGNIINYRN